MSYGGGSGSGRLSTSADVALSSITDGQVLAYAAGTQKWTNVSLPSSVTGSGSADNISAGAYNVVADGIVSTGSIAGGSSTLTITAGGLSNSHVGATVRIVGAGTSGAVLVTSVSSVTNATTAVLATYAATSVSSAVTLLGHNNLSPVYSALQAASKKVLTFPAGVYFMSNTLQIPAGTTVDATGATFLYGGFSLASNVTLRGATFIGDGQAIYGTPISWPTGGADDVVIINNTVTNHAWGILQNIQTSTPISRRAKIINNRFDSLKLGGTYLGNLTDSLFSGNISTAIADGCNTFNFQNTQQRNTIEGNIVNGGRAGIIHLWTYGYSPAPTATQGWDCYGNHITGNTIVGQSEEGISFDGGNGFDNASVASVSAGTKTVTLSGSAWSGAGSKWAYSWVTFLSGSLASRIYRIQAMNNAALTLDIDATDIAAISAGDALVICAPFHHNVIAGNYIDARKSSTYAIWLYSMSSFNTVAHNTIEGATIGTASTNSMAALSNTVTGSTCSYPSGYNVFTGNTLSGYSTVSATYNNAPGIKLDYVNYGNQTDFYTYGNVVTGNVVANGAITGLYNQKLSSGNVARGGAVYNNQPTAGSGGGLTLV